MSLRDLILRYRKDPRFIVSVPLVILAATSLVYYVTQQAKELTPEALSNRLLLFVLWNINLLLIIGILFVLLRGVVKLVLERQRGIIGSRFRTKLVVTYVATSLLPVVLLFLVATDLLRVSIDRWFATPVGTILENSEAIAQMAQDQSAEIAAGAAREIAASPDARDAAQIDRLLSHVREFHGVDMAAVYRAGILVKAQADPRAPIQEVADPSNRFFEEVARERRAVKIDVVPSGKWIRTAVPILGDDVAVAGVFIPSATSQRIDRSIIAYRDFQQLHSQRQQLKASQTSLFLAVTLAILFGTLWTSIYASRRITIPIKALAEATAKLAEGGYGHRVEIEATDEVGRLITSFNDMSVQLADQRQQLTETNRFMTTVLESVSTGIIAFTDELQVLSINRAALQMLQLGDVPPNANLAELLRGDLEPVAGALQELTSGRARTREVAAIVGGELHYLELSAARLGSGAGWVLALENSTQLVQAQKLAAWNEAARRIAHEIKNPLTPIQLSAERIARKFGKDQPGIEEGCRVIVDEVGQLKRMVDEFARFARMPAIHLRHAQLAEILQQAAGLYRDVKPGVTISVDVAPDIELLMDPEQIRRAVGNLLKNAVEATDRGEIRVSARRAPHRVVIEVADPGRGVPDTDKDKLFLPYFSTKGRGTGLGLAIVHRIVRDHDGQIHVHDNQPKGTRFEIELPASSSSRQPPTANRQPMARILIIDDEPAIRSTLGGILEDEGHRATLCESGEEGIAQLARDEFDVVLLDLWLPGIDGLGVLERLRTANGPPVIMISGHGSVDSAVRATRLGAYDFLEKPLSLERVLLTVNHALSDRRLREQVRDLRRHLTLEEILIGESEPMQRLEQQIRSAAASHSRVLITGENGSGKEIVARTLHRHSPRAEQPFIDVNCAAIPEELIESELFGHRKGAFTGAIDDRKGKFELADGGTLFLDEVGDMSLKTQAKVLRVLQEQTFQRVGGQQTIRVDVRVIAATNKNLEAEIAAGSFRSDLYYRLNVIPIEVPPLRARGNDVVLLAEHFLRRFAAETAQPRKKLSPGAAAKLKAYPWPGNVRELRNVTERLAILLPADTIEPEDIHLGAHVEAPVEIASNLPLKEAREQFEKQYILDRLREFGGNVSRTAESLGVERSNLYRKMDAYGIRGERP